MARSGGFSEIAVDFGETGELYDLFYSVERVEFEVAVLKSSLVEAEKD